MDKHTQLKLARAKIQEDLKGQTLLRVNHASLKKDDASHSENATFFLASGWYRDEPFHCRDCGKFEIWTAEQQKWWYEVGKGSVLTAAHRCRACRKAQRDERAKHAEKTKAGYAKKKKPNKVITAQRASRVAD